MNDTGHSTAMGMFGATNSAAPSERETPPTPATPTLEDRLRWFENRAREHELADNADEAFQDSELQFQRTKIIEMFDGLRAEASRPREATLNELRERIVRQAKSLPLGASWVGGGLDGASIYNSYMFAADLVDDALRAGVVPHRDTHMSTRHFVTFYYPGSFVDEEETREIDQRGAIGEIPAYVFGYQEWDREETACDGEILTGRPKNKGPMVYFGEAYTADEVEQLTPKKDYRILLSNMRGNGYERVVRTERGNWKPLTDDVLLLPPRKAAKQKAAR